METTKTPEQTSHKAYAAALAALAIYVIQGIITGEWAATETLAPALGVVLLPLAVWIVPNRPKDRDI